MKVSRLDFAGAVALSAIWGFSLGVAVAEWRWFEDPGSGEIARIPPTALNYATLLLPWVATLLFVLIRRRVGGSEGPRDRGRFGEPGPGTS